MHTAVFFKFVLLACIFAAVLLANLCFGEVSLSIGELMNIMSAWLHHAVSDSTASQILLDIRLPRALAAGLVGVALGVSGYQLQSLSNNGLADPYLTGVSSGAGLAVAAAIISGWDAGLIPVISLGGGLIASAIVLFLSRSNDGISVSRLLLSGVALSSFCSAVITLLVCSAQGSSRGQGIYYWLAGSVNGKNWDDLSYSSVYILIGLLIALIMSKPLRLLSLGRSAAVSLGVEISKAQIAILFSAILLCSAAVSLSGIVGFAGLIAPYFARQLFGRDERAHILSSAVIGAVLVLTSDLAARTLAAGQEPPLGTLLSLIGGPFFLFLLVKQEGASRL